MLCDVSLTVGPGERVRLSWPNGTGKTTLARIACGLVAPDSGSVAVDGSSEDLPLRVGYVRQDPVSQIVSALVEDEVAFGPRNLGLSTDEVRKRVDEALEACGIEHLRSRLTYELSGGEQQLLEVAGVLAMRPAYLVLDEAASMLDGASRERLEAVIERLLAKGVGVLDIEHVAVREKFEAGVDLENRARRIRSQGRRVPKRRQISKRLCGEMWSISAEDRVYRHVVRPQLRILRASAEKKSPASNSSRSGAGETTLELIDVSCRALKGFNFKAGPGLTLVTGPCGSGKTTAARIMAGVLAPNSGQALLNGHPVHAGEVGLCFQRPGDALFGNTVLEDLMYGPLMRGATQKEAEAEARAAAEQLGVDEELFQRNPFELSGGQARRVALAGAVASDPEAYVFDEPTAGLDAEGRSQLHVLVRELIDAGKPVVLITHDPDEWGALASEHIRMETKAESSAATSARRLDPRLAIALLLLATIVSFAVRTPVGAAIVAAGLVASAVATKTSPVDILRALRPAALLFALVLVCNGIVLYPAPSLSAPGFARGLTAVMRVAATVGFVRCLVTRDLLPRLAELLPKGAASTALGVALRFLPLTVDEVERIRSAQLARGARLDEGGVVARLKAWTQVLVPLIVGLFRRADELAEAMCSRGYRA